MGGEGFDGIPGEERKKQIEISRGFMIVLMEFQGVTVSDILNRGGGTEYFWKSPIRFSTFFTYTHAQRVPENQESRRLIITVTLRIL